MQSPTTESDPTPSEQSRCASWFARASSSAYVSAPVSSTAASRSPAALAAAAKSSWIASCRNGRRRRVHVDRQPPDLRVVEQLELGESALRRLNERREDRRQEARRPLDLGALQGGGREADARGGAVPLEGDRKDGRGRELAAGERDLARVDRRERRDLDEAGCGRRHRRPGRSPASARRPRGSAEAVPRTRRQRARRPAARRAGSGRANRPTAVSSSSCARSAVTVGTTTSSAPVNRKSRACHAACTSAAAVTP